MQIGIIIQNIILGFLSIQIFYLLIFSIAGRLVKKTYFPSSQSIRRIRIFIPGYKEDKVILSTAQAALNQDYLKELFEVVIIADSFNAPTIAQLKLLPVTLIQLSFEKSTKGKALQKAYELTIASPVDIVVILDADNHMAPGFLHAVNNAFEQGYEVVQGHRVAKNPETSFAFLDACTEEINNHIFRRGHVALGLPSALIGSGMAFSASLYPLLLKDIGNTSGEDKEFEFRLMRLKKKIAFLDGEFIYDEKVANNTNFSNQRSRWLAAQIEFCKKYFIEGWVQLSKGNFAFFNKVFQTFVLPRVMLVATLCLWVIWVIFFSKAYLLFSITLFISLIIALFLGIPPNWYTKKLLLSFLQIPIAIIYMVKALLQSNKAKKQFIHTPHGEQIKRNI